MTWMRVVIGVDDLAAKKATHLQDEFETEFANLAGPKGAAMFENSPSCNEHVFYFSPDAAAIFSLLLKVYDAAECKSPPTEGTTLLVGNSDASEALL
jgi:hypothetical protein